MKGRQLGQSCHGGLPRRQPSHRVVQRRQDSGQLQVDVLPGALVRRQAGWLRALAPGSLFELWLVTQWAVPSEVEYWVPSSALAQPESQPVLVS